MEAKIGISTENLSEVVHVLYKILADEYLLYTKTRKAHWNVEGADFYNKHKFFEAQYQQLEEIIDQVAERIRKLGHYAPASLKEFLALTQLSEDIRGNNDSLSFMKALLSDHESILINLRGCINAFAESYKDAGTSDFVTALVETHETMAWMLRAHFSNEQPG